jgi:uncharacterized lipoprotein YddW (UPF0748 family)
MLKIYSLLICLLLVVEAAAQKKSEPIRGTWITNVASEALYSKKNIRKAVKLCKKQGLNTIFVVVWNDGMTMYPSKVVEAVTGIKQDPSFKGFDPINEIVKEGHKQGLKVHAWFEFGFSYAYKDTASRWFHINKHWQGRKNKGELLQKNGFYWWSAIQPEVQKFLTDLVLEVITTYDVDGVQGDDRMPAMPAEGGYDEFTKRLFKLETGKEPPLEFNEENWLQWKADKMSAFGRQLYDAVKKTRPECIVSWSPSIYPWSKEQYLQDWPAWLNGGYADYIFPQLYRYDIAAYEKILKELEGQLKPGQKRVVFPGILTGLGDGYRIKDDMLKKILELNRQYGFKGECLFYFESLKTSKVPY